MPDDSHDWVSMGNRNEMVYCAYEPPRDLVKSRFRLSGSGMELKSAFVTSSPGDADATPTTLLSKGLKERQ